jgi:ketosteroid isomerase-like protein
MSDSAGSQACLAGDGTAKERVTKAFTEWDDTFDSGNATALAALYTAGAYVLPPKQAAVTGNAAIVQFFAAQFAQGVTGHVLVPFDIVDLGSTLIASSTWSAKVPDGKGGSTTVGGLATHVLQQQPDGSLKVRVHTFNYG